MMIFNQFAEMGNPLWHYNVTGYALAALFEAVKKPGQNFAGACLTSGSAGTMSAGDLLKERYPHLKLAGGEALQCPTILDNGFGGHRIEDITLCVVLADITEASLLSRKKLLFNLQPDEEYT